MITGRQAPELGAQEDFFDFVGVNYYIHNQWTSGEGGSMIVPSDPRYRHVRDLLQENFEHHSKPLFVAETGIEDETRPAWLRYICNEGVCCNREWRASIRRLFVPYCEPSGMGG